MSAREVSSHKKYFILAALCCIVVVLTCELGDSPVAPPVTKNNLLLPDSSLNNTLLLSIRTGGVTLASGSDTSFDIEAVVVNGNHNPVAGKEVAFTASGGVITAKDTTDNDGVAGATVNYSASFTENAIVIYARIADKDSVITVSARIDVSEAAVIADSINNNMQIHAMPSRLSAAYNEKSLIEVRVFDDNRNPIIGREISFTATKGTITAKDFTDTLGIALADYFGEPVNGNAVVSAKMKFNDSLVAVATTVTLGGIELIVVPQLTKAPIGSIVPVSIKLLDGKGNPLPDKDINYTVVADSVKTTSGAGEIETAVTRSTSGTIVVKAWALGARDSAVVYFGNTAPVDVDNTVRSLRLFTSHSQMRADNSAEATVTAIIISEDNHNPLIGDTVEFSSTLGIIDKFGVTDESGRTSVTLRSAPVNGSCIIRAVLKGNSAIADSTSVLFSGVTLSLSVDRDDIRINDTAVITALLKDGSGNPISSDYVSFTVTAPGKFADQSRFVQSSLSANGNAVVKATSGTAGTVVVHAASANVTDSIIIRYTTNNITISAAKSRLIIGGKDSTQIYAKYVDASGNALSGKTITFATNAGSISQLTVNTGSDGVATTWLKSGFFSTVATVQAKSNDGSAYQSVVFTADIPKAISLAITPDNIGINGGIAELIAVVKDDSGNVVSGAEVSFKILKGPGGGEAIDKPIIVSTNDGIAKARLLAGALPSEYRGCEVEATVGAYSATSKLTISGEPHTITVSRPEDDTVTVPKGGIMDESTFEYFIGAVVKDVNGNPVADGTPVNFSSVVSGMSVARRTFVRFETGNGDVKPIYDYCYLDIPFEDMNGNKKFDVGIDLDIDIYPTIAARGDDRNGDGTNSYDYLTNGIFYDFNNNGVCDTSNDNPSCEPYFEASFKYDLNGDTTYEVFADLNRNGTWDRNECSNGSRLLLPAAMFTMPLGFDFDFWRWEMRPHFHNQQLDFSNNDFAVVIDRTAVTKDGVAYTKLTYPRQFAHRLYATVNAEVKGLRDKDGERFVLPVIR